MSKITKKIKRRLEENRKKVKANDIKSSVTTDEIVTEDVSVKETNTDTVKETNADLLRKSYTGIKNTLAGPRTTYGKSSVVPISVTPKVTQQLLPPPVPETAQSITPTTTQPAPTVVPINKREVFTQNVKSLVKDYLEGTNIGQMIGTVKDYSSQFKDLFKTQEQLIVEQAVEEEKRKKKEQIAQDRIEKLKIEALKAAGLYVEKDSTKPKKSEKPEQIRKPVDKNVPEVSDVTSQVQIIGDVNENISKIRTLLETDAQKSVHSMEVEKERGEQQATIVKTLQGIEKGIKSADVTKKSDEESIDSGKGGFLNSLKNGFLGKMLGKFGGKLPGPLGKLAIGASSLLTGGMNASATAATAASTGSKAASVASPVSKAAGAFSKVASKALGPLAAIADIGMGGSDLLEGKRQTEAPSGLEMLSPMRWGMYGGEQLNQTIQKASGGTPLGSLLYDAFNKPEQTQTGADLYQKSILAAKKPRIVEMKSEPKKSLSELTEQVTESYNKSQTKKTASEKITPVVITQPTVQTQSTKDRLSLFDTRRNTENTFQRLQNKMFTGGMI